MSTWRRQAIEGLPEFRPLIESAASPMALWIELHLKFVAAVHADDASLTGRLLNYAAWCFSDRSGPLPNDTSTAAACAFYEHLPTHKEFWPRLGAWFSPDEFANLLPVFVYHLSAEELAALKVAYAEGRPFSTGGNRPSAFR